MAGINGGHKENDMKDNFKITQRDISTLPNGTYLIESNLYLRVRGPSASFFLRMTIDGKRTQIWLGSTKQITLAIAKAKAANLKSRHELGEDILAEHEEKKRAKKEEKVPTFAEVAKSAIDSLVATKKWSNPKSEKQWRSTIETYAIPKIGKKPINTITTKDILSVVEPIWETKPDTASRLLGRLERIIKQAMFLGLYPVGPNPASWGGNLDMILPPISKVKEVKHQAAMTLDEAKQVTARFKDSPHLSHKATLFGLLTACRVQEFLLAKWDEIDFETKTFSVPPDRRKDQKPYPHRVPLSTQAVELLHSIERHSEYVFANPRTGRPLNLETPAKALQDNVENHVTMHGCRSTFRDWCQETAVDFVTAEKCLMHATGDKVVAAYQRSDLLDQRRVVMQDWADCLFGVESKKTDD